MALIDERRDRRVVRGDCRHGATTRRASFDNAQLFVYATLGRTRAGRGSHDPAHPYAYPRWARVS
jgi:hypothetical protein